MLSLTKVTCLCWVMGVVSALAPFYPSRRFDLATPTRHGFAGGENQSYAQFWCAYCRMIGYIPCVELFCAAGRYFYGYRLYGNLGYMSGNTGYHLRGYYGKRIHPYFKKGSKKTYGHQYRPWR